MASFLDAPLYLPVLSPITSGTTQRSADVSAQILDLHDLSHPRYLRDAAGTKCNLYVLDVARAHACPMTSPNLFHGRALAPEVETELLKYILPDAVEQLKAPRWRELDANALVLWLTSADAHSLGWRDCDAEMARQRASVGQPSVVGWYNPAGIGHVAWVIPTPEGMTGVWLSQAGAHNSRCVAAVEIFPRSAALRFFTHD